MKILKTWNQGNTCKISPIIAEPPEGCECESTDICCVQQDLCCVYPAICGNGPNSVKLFGITIFKNGSLPNYGNKNKLGVFLENGMWVGYQDGKIVASQDCIRFSSAIEPNIPTSFSFSWSVFYPEQNETRSASGLLIKADDFTQECQTVGDFIDCGDVGQCQWQTDGLSYQQNPIGAFDEAFTLLFDRTYCRWVLASGSLFVRYAFKETDPFEPTGTYLNPLAIGSGIVV